MSKIVTLNAPGRPEPEGFTHVAVASGSKTVYLAGQVSSDENGDIVGDGDLAAQTSRRSSTSTPAWRRPARPSPMW